MNKEQYKEQRQTLMNEAEALITENKTEEAEAKMEEVKGLDNKWEEAKKANANLNALKDDQKALDIENKSEDVKEAKVVGNMIEVKEPSEQKQYENAWAKKMMGKRLEGGEQEVFDKVNTEFSNAYTHDTGNTGILIPETVAAGIFKRAEEQYPLYADAKKYSVSGKLSIKKHDSIDAGDAAWYTEGTNTADEQNTFGELVLDGHELSKAVTVSWKLKSMAMDEFIPFIINELGDRVGVALGTAAAQGTGSGQPQGVETALLNEAGTPQVVTYDPTATTPVELSYDIITKAIGSVYSSYLRGSRFYVNNATIWNQLVNVMDGNKRPYFQPDPTGQYAGRMFGYPVVADAGISNGSIIFGNAGRSLVFNTNEPFSVVTEDHAKARTTDYVAYAIVDGGVLDTKAFALIDNTATA